jgi:hydrolase, TatD family
MSATYVDSHAHMTSNAVFEQVDALLDRAKQAGIADIVNICTDVETLQRGLELAKRAPWVHTVAATTPHDVATEGDAVFPIMAHHARNGDLVAVGETGLDYFHHHSPPEQQKEFLRRYLHLALECRLPVVIHCREAFADFFSILDAEYMTDGKHAPGVLHCFTGTEAEAEEVIKRGWYLSLSGIVTFKKSDVLRNVAKMVPLDRLLIETDTPYLAPQSHRGHTNEPAFLPETAAVIAACRGIPAEEVAKATSDNARSLFRLTRTESS